MVLCQGMGEPAPDGVGNDGVGDDLCPVIQRQLRRERDRFSDGSFFQDLTQILRFCGSFSPRRPTSCRVRTYPCASAI